jgi:glycerate 2-kinase
LAEITLTDLREANRLLVSSGATIAEINSVRRAFSAIKGGGLSRMAPNADQVTLILSDTNAGDEANVASGPTIPPVETETTAQEIIRLYKLESRLPRSILKSIEQYEPSDFGKTVNSNHYVLLDNETALRAASSRARELGFHTEIAQEICEQPIEQGCSLLFERVEKLQNQAGQEAKVCLISGGEFSCPVRGDGMGGRNSETVLRCAIELERHANVSDIAILSAGTDGIDGNSPAAGAVADETTITRATVAGIDAASFLNRSDAYSFFEKLGDAVITGPTGTNVRDVRILLLGSRASKSA